MREAPRTLAALCACLSLALPVRALAQFCPPGQIEDPSTGACKPKEEKKKRKDKDTTPAVPTYGESAEEKERKAKLARDYCETQCLRSKADCRPDQNCEEKDRLCRLACFQRFLADLPVDRSEAAEAQENLKGESNQVMQEASAALKSATELSATCPNVLASAVHELGPAARRSCEVSAAKAKSATAAFEGVKAAFDAFAMAKKKPDVLDALDRLHKSGDKVMSLSAEALSETNSVLQLSLEWKKAIERTEELSRDAQGEAETVAAVAAQVETMSRRDPTADSKEHAKKAGAAAEKAQQRAKEATETVDLVKAQELPKQTEIPIAAQQMMLAEIQRGRADAEAQLDLEKARHAELDRQEQARRDEAERIEQERQRVEREKEEQRLAEQRRVQALIDERERVRRTDAEWRGRGMVAMAAGGASLLGAGALLGLAEMQNRAIQAGGFATAQDIQTAVSLGHTYDRAALGLGVTALACLAVGAPIFLLHPDPGPLKLSITVGSNGAALAISGSLP